MRIRHALSAAAVGAALTLGGLAAPVQAAAFGKAASAASAAPAAAAAVPCISTDYDGNPDGFGVRLENYCTSTTARVRVIVDWAPDSSCYVIPPGQSRLYIYEGILGTYAGVASC